MGIKRRLFPVPPPIRYLPYPETVLGPGLGPDSWLKRRDYPKPEQKKLLRILYARLPAGQMPKALRAKENPLLFPLLDSCR